MVENIVFKEAVKIFVSPVTACVWLQFSLFAKSAVIILAVNCINRFSGAFDIDIITRDVENNGLVFQLFNFYNVVPVQACRIHVNCDAIREICCIYLASNRGNHRLFAVSFRGTAQLIYQLCYVSVDIGLRCRDYCYIISRPVLVNMIHRLIAVVLSMDIYIWFSIYRCIYIRINFRIACKTNIIILSYVERHSFGYCTFCRVGCQVNTGRCIFNVLSYRKIRFWVIMTFICVRHNTVLCAFSENIVRIDGFIVNDGFNMHEMRYCC